MKMLSVSHFEEMGTKVNSPIWGINTSAQSILDQSGEVLVSIPKANGNGQPDALRIQQTWLPQELTRDIPRQRLLRSSEFRKAVTSKLIGLIDVETAQRMLRQSGAKEEQERLDAQARHVRTAGAARTIKDTDATISRADGIVDDEDDGDRNKTVIIDYKDKSVAQIASAGVEDVEDGITPAFKMFCDKLSLGKDLAAKNEIKGRRSFTRAELAYLHRNLPRSFKETLSMLS